MKYTLNQEYIAKRKRGFLLTAIMFAVIAFLMVVIGVFTENYGMFLGLIFLLFSWQSIPSIKYWSKYGTKIYLEIVGSDIIQGNSDQEVKISLASLAHMTVQKKGNAVKSILLKFESGGFHKFEGFENIDQLATEIEKIIGSSKVRVAKWLHR